MTIIEIKTVMVGTNILMYLVFTNAFNKISVIQININIMYILHANQRIFPYLFLFLLKNECSLISFKYSQKTLLKH